MLTVGEILRKYREKQNIQLSEVEKQIKIRAKLLQAIEDNNWNFFSSKIYIVGIIKNYSTFLGLDTKKILAFFRRDYEKKEEVKFKTRVSSSYLKSETKRLAIGGLSVLFIIFFGYFGFQLKAYFSPPSLTVIEPTKTSFTIEDKVKFVGKTDKDALVSIYGERVYQDKYGIFSYDVALKNGSNDLIIEITGANGKKTTIKKTFVRKNPF
ncbi:MAG: helix-turn-helix domain-containing protein [bacterium]|nr:helix-turn-helix domain-containing protein [bacterium]